MKEKVSIFWFRRDLRLEDNVGLYHALTSGFPVLPVFIFDSGILEKLENKKDRRVDYIHQVLTAMNTELKKYGSALLAFYGRPVDAFQSLTKKYDIRGVYCNRDYEPQAIERDANIDLYFQSLNIPFKACKDQAIFDTNDILKKDATPYTVYTPYAKKWRAILGLKHYASVDWIAANFFRHEFSEIPSLEGIGFEKTGISFQKPVLDSFIIDNYDKYRDYPALQGTTLLGMALRFGTISIRKCVDFALKHNGVWLSELIWREFFKGILYHFPRVVNQSFKPRYDRIHWRNDEEEFQLWREGKTGYPMVDAGMRQLNETGFMHNRARMIAASFLCKHLLIDWRWGEAYFAEKLNDYDLSSNNGNWQWAAGCGCDAAPYFRIFNPDLQTRKFDKDLKYIKRWVPEYGTLEYSQPVVEHSFARNRALSAYGMALRS